VDALASKGRCVVRTKVFWKEREQPMSSQMPCRKTGRLRTTEPLIWEVELFGFGVSVATVFITQVSDK
jgi:hypothetical protein